VPHGRGRRGCPEDERAVVGLASREVDIVAVFDEYDAHESARCLRDSTVHIGDRFSHRGAGLRGQ
jgi:hypothetical protein